MKEVKVSIGKNKKLDLEMLTCVTRDNISVEISSDTQKAMKETEKVLNEFVNERLPIYGLSTQFGDQVTLLDTELKGSEEDYRASLKKRQLNLVKSHNIGVGPEAKIEFVRGALLLRAHCLGQGYAGIRTDVVHGLVAFLNAKIHPIIRRFGSIGASGDLIPLAAVAAALVAEDTDVDFDGDRMSAKDALIKSNIAPIELETREGLALINGTSFMTSIAAHSLYDLKRTFSQMLKALAVSLEALSIIDSAYAPLVHKLKNHKGEEEVNDFFVSFWKGSHLVRNLTDSRKKGLDLFKSGDGSSNENAEHLQDYYSLRSIPQGFGPMKENLETATRWIENEMNSVNDNPIISTHPSEIYHQANFMGYYVTEACDLLKMDIAQASTWLHAILANMVHPRKNFGLPANISTNPSVFNSFRPIQILAASLAVQNRKLAQVQQAFMIPTEGDNQDVNSLASHAAFDLSEAVGHLETLTAILLLAGAQAIELRGIENAGKEAQVVHKAIRSVSPFIDSDRKFSVDIENIKQLMREEKI